MCNYVGIQVQIYIHVCKVGNFFEVLIFVVFVVDSAVTKYPPTKINGYHGSLGIEKTLDRTSTWTST